MQEYIQNKAIRIYENVSTNEIMQLLIIIYFYRNNLLNAHLTHPNEFVNVNFVHDFAIENTMPA